MHRLVHGSFLSCSEHFSDVLLGSCGGRRRWRRRRSNPNVTAVICSLWHPPVQLRVPPAIADDIWMQLHVSAHLIEDLHSVQECELLYDGSCQIGRQWSLLCCKLLNAGLKASNKALQKYPLVAALNRGDDP